MSKGLFIIGGKIMRIISTYMDYLRLKKSNEDEVLLNIIKSIILNKIKGNSQEEMNKDRLNIIYFDAYDNLQSFPLLNIFNSNYGLYGINILNVDKYGEYLLLTIDFNKTYFLVHLKNLSYEEFEYLSLYFNAE